MPDQGVLSQSSFAHPSQAGLALNRFLPIAEYGLDGQLVSANPQYQSLFGIPVEHPTGLQHHDLVPEDTAATLEYRDFWQALRAGTVHSEQSLRQRADGSRCWVKSTYLPIEDSTGTQVRVLEIAEDVTTQTETQHQYQTYIENLALISKAGDPAVLCTDAKGRITYVNDGFERMFGWTLAEINERDPFQLLAPTVNQEFVDLLNVELAAGNVTEREEIVSGKGGQRYWAKLICNPILDANQQLEYTVTVLVDITQAKLHQALHRRVLELMVRETPLSDVLEALCLEVERIAPEFTSSILAVDEEGKLHPLAGPNLPADYCHALDGLAIGPSVGSCGTAAWRNESIRVDDIATDPRWQPYLDVVMPLGFKGCWSTPFQNSQGKVIGTFAFYYRQPLQPRAAAFQQSLVDACTHLCTLALERELARQHIRQLVFYDELTGMPNLNLLQAKADQLIASATRTQEPLAVLFVDLDRFKQINDSLGRHAGDVLLREVAVRLNNHLRASDIAGRLSGDEFVIVLPDCSVDRATDLVERIQNLISNPILVGETSLSTSASIGIAMFPSDGRDIGTLLHRADMAMHQAKTAGRGQFSFFRNEMNQLAQERLMLENALREAIHNGELRLHYQPQVDLASGHLYGVEALARWKHPTLGDISPARFIPLAEECGLIADLGRCVLRKACEQLASWRAADLPVPTVSVNLSPTSFHNLELPQMIADTLLSNDLTSDDLTVELTESVLLDTHPSTMKTVAEVHAQGIRLSMDDFGTGYSSLSYLRRIPVSELKLDRSFVADLEHDEAARALSNAIIGIGKSLKLTVVAEGVENAEQNAMLQKQGYPVAQGYLFSRPLPPEELEAWLTEFKNSEHAGPRN